MSNFNVVEYIGGQEEFFTPVLSDDSIKWEKEKQFAIQAFQGNKFLADTAAKNTASLQNAIINVASIGISLNPANKHAYLVPRDGKVCLDISYMGLLHLAMTSGSILWGQCKLVHESDTYTSNGLDKAPTHSYSPFGDRGSVVGAYCTVKTADGDYLTDEMPLDDIVKIQNSSKAKNGPWKNHWNEMARKTVVKRASKYWPTVDRLDNAIHHLNTDSGEGLVAEKDVTPSELITSDQVDVLFPLLCDADGYFTEKGEQARNGFKFDNLNDIPAKKFNQILKAVS
jgi:recombination protein RecT